MYIPEHHREFVYKISEDELEEMHRDACTNVPFNDWLQDQLSLGMINYDEYRDVYYG